MNTTAAALQANVTADTIRTWCRRGAVAALKQAGRWIIDTASLAHRIAIGQRRTRKAATVSIDLTATYTFTHAGDTAPTTVTPTVKTRTRPTGETITTISNLAPLFADRFDAIPDNGDRVAALTVFRSAHIVISDQHDADWDDDPQTRDGGQLRTTYRGGVPRITVADVLDLAAQLRAQLAA
ncbi:hypothetical protein ABZ725_14715 [Streptomyces sp. NPDC006872]|uniref:hypothetical protein n=1 Tax=Streptomyces sp. NPDC006872 TaxID=3155720 RepID=UPI003411E322